MIPAANYVPCPTHTSVRYSLWGVPQGVCTVPTYFGPLTTYCLTRLLAFTSQGCCRPPILAKPPFGSDTEAICSAPAHLRRCHRPLCHSSHPIPICDFADLIPLPDAPFATSPVWFSSMAHPVAYLPFVPGCPSASSHLVINKGTHSSPFTSYSTVLPDMIPINQARSWGKPDLPSHASSSGLSCIHHLSSPWPGSRK